MLIVQTNLQNILPSRLICSERLRKLQFQPQTLLIVWSLSVATKSGAFAHQLG